MPKIKDFYRNLKFKVTGSRAASGEKRKKTAQEQSGQTKTHILMNFLLQVAMTIAFVFNVQHETYPKPMDVPDPPGLGEPGGCPQMAHSLRPSPSCCWRCGRLRAATG
jgi:hypothetical protein